MSKAIFDPIRNKYVVREEEQKEYAIRMLDYCLKKYQKLIKKDTVLQKWVETYLKEIQTHPNIGEDLYANFPGCRSIHFLGNKYRIVYKVIDEPTPEILVCEIAHRKDAYIELARALGQGK